MIDFLNNMGLGSLIEDDDTVERMIKHTVTVGKPIKGYNGYTYFNHHLGNVQLIATVKEYEDRGEFLDFNVHTSGNSVWEARVIGMDVNIGDDCFRRIAVTNPDGKGLAVVNIVNSEVLPSYAEDEIIRLQMIAYPVEIDYYADEEAYAESEMCKTANGRKLCLADGTFFPSGLFSCSDIEDKDERQEMCGYMLIKGTVKHLYVGKINLGEETLDGFVKCIIDTEFGELEIVHTIDMVKKDMLEYLKIGSAVSALCFLSGDPAIDEYENGYLCNAHNNLAVLRTAFETGNPEYLNDVLSEEVEYYSEESEKHLFGKDEIIKWVHYVQDTRSKPCTARYATITETEKDGEKTEYEIGTECLALSYEKIGQYENLAFADFDIEEKIKRIFITKGFGYRFESDVISEPDPELELERKDTIDSMLARANFLMLKDEIEREELDYLIEAKKQEFKTRIYDMCQALETDPDNIISDKETAKAIISYFFAMNVINKNQLWKFNKEECFADSLPTAVPEDKLELYFRAHKDGGFLYNDIDPPEAFKLLRKNNDIIEVLCALQAIAQKYE